MTLRAPDEVAKIAVRLLAERYPGAAFAYACGSLLRGEGTPSSDLDLVVVYRELPNAWRESFECDGLPVEAFVHDPGTLRYFMAEVDCASGCPLMPHMVSTGVEVPGPTDLSAELKATARELLDAGPSALSDEERLFGRYMLTDALDDLLHARARAEAAATAAQLYAQVGDTYLRARGRWSGKGKWLPRLLREDDPDYAERFAAAFEAVWRDGDASGVARVAEEALAPIGGLFRFAEGFRQDAPPECKGRCQADRTVRCQGAVVRGDAILLIRYRASVEAAPYWLIPGGGREPGETDEACAVRELREETHVQVRVERLLFEDDDIPGGTYRRRRTYLCSVVDGDEAPGVEPEESVAPGCGIIGTDWFDLRHPETWCDEMQSDPVTYPLVLAIREALGYT